MKKTRLVALIIFAGCNLTLLASERDPFERPVLPAAGVLWQLKGTLVTAKQSFAFFSHSTLGDCILQSHEKLPGTDWWLLQIAPGTVKLQQQKSEQTLDLQLPRQK